MLNLRAYYFRVVSNFKRVAKNNINQNHEKNLHTSTSPNLF